MKALILSGAKRTRLRPLTYPSGEPIKERQPTLKSYYQAPYGSRF